MRKFGQIAAAVFGLGVAVVLSAIVRHAHGAVTQTADVVASPTAVASPTPYPDSMRIPANLYSQAGTGIAITPVDPSTQPQGSIVSQPTAEAVAESYGGPGTLVYGAGLANVSGLGGTDSGGTKNGAGLYWIVSIDPGYGALRHESGGHSLNWFNVFVNATTGKGAAANGSYDPAYQPFANGVGDPTPAAGSTGGLKEAVGSSGAR